MVRTNPPETHDCSIINRPTATTHAEVLARLLRDLPALIKTAVAAKRALYAHQVQTVAKVADAMEREASDLLADGSITFEEAADLRRAALNYREARPEDLKLCLEREILALEVGHVVVPPDLGMGQG